MKLTKTNPSLKCSSMIPSLSKQSVSVYLLQYICVCIILKLTAILMFSFLPNASTTKFFIRVAQTDPIPDVNPFIWNEVCRLYSILTAINKQCLILWLCLRFTIESYFYLNRTT